MVQVSTGESQLESRNQRALKRESGLFSSPARGRFHAREHGTEATRNYDLIILSAHDKSFNQKTAVSGRHSQGAPARPWPRCVLSDEQRAAAGLGLGGGGDSRRELACQSALSDSGSRPGRAPPAGRRHRNRASDGPGVTALPLSWPTGRLAPVGFKGAPGGT